MKRLVLYLAIITAICVIDGFSQKVAPSLKKELAQLMLNNGDIQNSCVRKQGGLSKAISIRLEYLNSDLQPEYVVSGDGSCCGGVSNCNSWIYQKTSSGYRKIYGSGLQSMIGLGKSRAKGYRDICSIDAVDAGRVSAFRAIYRFDGSQYKLWKILKATAPCLDGE